MWLVFQSVLVEVSGIKMVRIPCRGVKAKCARGLSIARLSQGEQHERMTAGPDRERVIAPSQGSDKTAAVTGEESQLWAQRGWG